MSTTPTQLVTFRIGDDLFAADIFAVERVLRHQPATPIPNVPPWIDGVIDYHRHVVPVINMRARFELAAVPTHPAMRLLVFQVNDEWIAALVDAVVEVIAVAPEEVAPPPPIFRGLAGEYLRGVVRRNQQLIVLLDAARLLSATERLHLDEAIGDRLIVEHSGQEAL